MATCLRTQSVAKHGTQFWGRLVGAGPFGWDPEVQAEKPDLHRRETSRTRIWGSMGDGPAGNRKCDSPVPECRDLEREHSLGAPG